MYKFLKQEYQYTLIDGCTVENYSYHLNSSFIISSLAINCRSTFPTIVNCCWTFFRWVQSFFKLVWPIL